MKAFHTIAVPHKDILSGRLTMDVFAADLWEVSNNRGPEEYRDSDAFFKKTYLTDGLSHLTAKVEQRLKGKTGDPVIQIQTPFGGGKTHSLIALYHKAQEWGTKRVVISGTVLSADETIWGTLEKQLTGKITKLTGKVSPGKEAIRSLLDKNQPLLILMDEILAYATKASGIQVAESSLASQTIAFMQELAETVSMLEKASLVVTLPSSRLEHYDEGAERMFQQLIKVMGRQEKIYTPVQDHEISKIIRRRLFGHIDMDEVKKVVSSYIEYAEKESILPAGILPTEYRGRFIDSYPFMPEVIDTLYHRWGSYPTFQRTRGVLRLLSLVIHALKESGQSYISLADFDLANQDIRQELLKHIGPEFNSVIASDITDPESGSKKADRSLGSAYQGLKLGKRTGTTIFLYSFSGGTEKGTTIAEIKRSATSTVNPSSVVSEAVEQLKNKLFYLQNRGDKYYFSNQPNLNRIVLTYMENVDEEKELTPIEKDLIKASISGSKLKVYIWEESPANIPDTEELKLVILKNKDEKIIEKIIETKGQTPRVYRNTLVFLHPSEAEKSRFKTSLKKMIAFENIKKDESITLSDYQKKELHESFKRIEKDVKESIRRVYRIITLPDKEGIKDIDLGIPTYGEEKSLDQDVYERLRLEGRILEKIAPLVIKEKYLSGKEYVSTEQIYKASLTTPGEPVPTAETVISSGIDEGVNMGLFGLGELKDDKPVVNLFKEKALSALTGNEIIITEDVCISEKEGKAAHITEITHFEGSKEKKETIEESEIEVEQTGQISKNKIHLKFTVPHGKLSDIMRTLNLIQRKFNKLEIEVTATEGNITDQDYEDKILETFRQLGIDV
jgi:hypothetical protein